MMQAAMFYFTVQGGQTARRIVTHLAGEYACTLYAPEKYAACDTLPIEGGLTPFIGALFEKMDALIYVGACGIAVRAIAPYVRSKTTDPAVVSVDELGKFSVPLLSGHIGGGNRLAQRIAAGIGAIPVITTATDVNGRFSVDTWASRHGFVIGGMDGAKHVSAAILTKDVPISADKPIRGTLPPGLYRGESGPIGISVSIHTGAPFEETLPLIPRVLTLGVGCRRGASCEAIEEAVTAVFDENKLDLRAVKEVVSIDLKADEPGLKAFCLKHSLPARFLTAQALAAVPGAFTPSPFVQSVTGVDNVCERSAASAGGALIVKKAAFHGVTVAVAEAEWEVSFG